MWRAETESFLESPTPAVSGESRYLTPLWVKGNRDRSDSLITSERIEQHYQKIQDKITAALKLLTFRELHVLVQFWCEVGKRHLLTTLDQPFGFGVIDERLWSYRRDSERRSFVVDKDHEEGYHSPAVRVFRSGLPEWTSDLDSYTPKHFPQQECALLCNFHGYLALPVFDSTTGLRVGVLELLTFARYTSYAYEVQRIHNALKTVGLKTQQAFDSPFLNVPNERRQKDFNKIYSTLKNLCDIFILPLAQTWAVSQYTSFVSHEKVLEKSCSSFDTRCVGKVCMSRAALPYHVQDMRMWPFFKASSEQHLDWSHGLVGRALLSRGSCFSEDLTKLGEEEYPLVHIARMNRLTGCFAIFLHSVEANDDYVLEFYLPPNMKERVHVLNLVQTLKQHFEIASGFELGDSSCIQVVRPPTEDGISLSIDSGTFQIASTATTNNNHLDIVTSDSVSMVVNAAAAESAGVSNQWPSKKIYTDTISHDLNVLGTRTNDNVISYPDVSMQKKSDDITEQSKQGRKRKVDSLTMEKVEKHFGRPIDQASRSLSVGESTLKRDLTSWPPLPKDSKTTPDITNLKLSQISWPKKGLQRPSNIRFGLFFVVFLMVRVKRWSCSSKSHGFSGKWWSCGRHGYLPFESNFIYQTAFLIVRLKRWRNKISKRKKMLNSDHHAVSESTAKPKYTTDIINNVYSRVTESSLVLASPKQTEDNISDRKIVTVKAAFKDDMIKFQFPTSSGLSELEHEVGRRINLKSKRLCLKYMDEEKDGILLACDADLHNLLRRTTNGTNTIKLIIQTADYSLITESGHVLASSKQTADNISGTKIVTVKATFKDDMIKFQFPTSSGLSELEHEVGRRINLKSKRLCLKYMDEEKDGILLACDADLHNLLRHTANGSSTIKLVIQAE